MLAIFDLLFYFRHPLFSPLPGCSWSLHRRTAAGVLLDTCGIIRVVTLRHPVPLVVMVICQQETEYRVHRHTAVFVLAVVL